MAGTPKPIAKIMDWTREKSLEPVAISSTLLLPSHYKAPRYKWAAGWIAWWVLSTLLYFLIMMLIYKHWK